MNPNAYTIWLIVSIVLPMSPAFVVIFGWLKKRITTKAALISAATMILPFVCGICSWVSYLTVVLAAAGPDPSMREGVLQTYISGNLGLSLIFVALFFLMIYNTISFAIIGVGALIRRR